MYNVESLALISQSLQNELPNLVKWFPKLRHLEMNSVHSDTSGFGVFFPHLEQKTLEIGYSYTGNWEWVVVTGPNNQDKLTPENIKVFLHAN